MKENLKSLKWDILRYRLIHVFYACLLVLFAWLIVDCFYDDFLHKNSIWINIGCMVIVILIAWVRHVEIKERIEQKISFLIGLSHVVIKTNQDRLVSLLSLKEEFSELSKLENGANTIAKKLSEIHYLKKDRVIEYCRENSVRRTEFVISSITIPTDTDSQRKVIDEMDEAIREDNKQKKMILAELEKLKEKF